MMDTYARQRQAIRQAMEYAVPDGFLQAAHELLDLYRNDRFGLTLLHEFYSYLPEARNDWIREIRLISRLKGVFLLAALTPAHGYLYLVSSEGIEFHGTVVDGYLDQDLLDFFGFANPEAFAQICRDITHCQLYEPLDRDEHVCPACHAATGECHELGCPVEVCPWCGGQLVHCNCRYDRLELDIISTRQEISRFEKLLEEQGRIPYAPEQRPFFSDEGNGVLLK